MPIQRLLTCAALGCALQGCVLGCGMTATEVRDRDLCYERAETAAQRRVDVECQGATFSECPRGNTILDDLRKAQEACP